MLARLQSLVTPLALLLFAILHVNYSIAVVSRPDAFFDLSSMVIYRLSGISTAWFPPPPPVSCDPSTKVPRGRDPIRLGRRRRKPPGIAQAKGPQRDVDSGERSPGDPPKGLNALWYPDRGAMLRRARHCPLLFWEREQPMAQPL